MKLIPYIILLVLAACSGTNFSSDTGGKKSADKGDADGDDSDGGPDSDSDAGDSDADGSDSDTEDGGIDSDDSGADDDDIIIGDENVVEPKECTSANIAVVPGTATNCPAHFAAYAADDADNPKLTCCPLPVKNILKSDPAQARQTCLSDEVATGVSGGSLMCTKINTDKYRLGPAVRSCYIGSGSSGSSGAGTCTVPPGTMAAMNQFFGSDACVGMPYGALIVSWTGDDCGDVQSAQLFDNATSQPIIMHP
jgi:hypothetical protein